MFECKRTNFNTNVCNYLFGYCLVAGAALLNIVGVYKDIQDQHMNIVRSLFDLIDRCASRRIHPFHGTSEYKLLLCIYFEFMN